MAWKNFGRIFNPTQFNLPNNCTEFAQSPQTLVFDDFVRIYFSTREVDETGKFLSHIAYVDMDKSFARVLKTSDETVLPLGELGCFDEHGIFPINPIAHGGEIFAYTCGWNRRKSVSVDTGIGLVKSTDSGKTFQRLGPGPILSQSLNEPFLVGDAFVKVYDGVFHMWYMYGTAWTEFDEGKQPERTYKIGHATSTDGIEWNKEEAQQIIADTLGEYESQALPSVVKIDDIYRMVFCYRSSNDFRTNSKNSYQLGHAWSQDLKSWTRDDRFVADLVDGSDWNSDMQCYPHIFWCDNKVYLLHNGNQFGRFGFGLSQLMLD